MIRVYCSVSRVNPVPVINGHCMCCGRKVRTVQ